MLDELYMTCQVVWKDLLFKQTMFCLLFFSPVTSIFRYMVFAMFLLSNSFFLLLQL